MLYKEKKIILKDGRICLFRAPRIEDAKEMLEYLKTCAAETDFILRYPEECTETVEEEADYLNRLNTSENNLMIVAIVDKEIAGNCQIMFNKRLKMKHRAGVAIALKRKYWRLGIGTRMFEEMIALAKEKKVSVLELEYIEGNERGKALYEKMGFVKTGEKPDAIRLKDGTRLKAIMMDKTL